MRLYFSKQKIFWPFVFIIFVAIEFCLVTNFVRSEDYVYFGDFTEYFNKFEKFSKVLIDEKSVNVISEISKSIRTEDYNIIPIFPLEIFGVINASRLTYILSIYLVYFTVSAFIYFYVLKKLSNKFKISNLVFVGIASMYFLSPTLLSPLLRGEPSIGGTILIFASLLIYFNSNYTLRKIYWSNNLLLSFILAMLPIFRRWFIFYVISFLLIIFIDLTIIYVKEKSKKLFSVLLTNYLQILFSTILIFLLITGNLYQRYLAIALGNQYSVYKFGSIYFTFYVLFGRIGYLYLIAFVLSLILLMKTKITRRFATFIFSVLVATTTLFLRTQDFSDHHFYLIIPIIFLTIGLGLIVWKSRFKNICIFIFIIFNVYNLALVTTITRQTYIDKSFLFSQIDTHPLIRTDNIELRRLFDYLGNTVMSEETIYILSSTDVLGNPINDDVFRNYCRDKEFEKQYICANVLQTATVDIGSGFPYYFFKADYVIMNNPVGYFLHPENQRVIGNLAEFVKQSKDYQIVNSFADNDIVIEIYKRLNPVSDDQISKLENDFNLLYPNSIFK